MEKSAREHEIRRSSTFMKISKNIYHRLLVGLNSKRTVLVLQVRVLKVLAAWMARCRSRVTGLAMLRCVGLVDLNMKVGCLASTLTP